MSRARRAGIVWTALAVLLFAAGVGRQFGGLLERGVAERVAFVSESGAASSGLIHDVGYVVWAVGRNSRVLATRPWRLFDAEPCHPVEKALALGEPAISLGLVGVVPWVLTRDPLATFNLVLLAVSFLGALALFLVVRDWTGEPAAGIAAGIYAGFHAPRLADPIHLYVWDYTGALLAFFFARRLFDSGRWRDALGLSACVALQLGGSLYALLGSAALGLPVLVWLLARYGSKALRTGPMAFVLIAVVLTAAIFFWPSLDLLRDGMLPPRNVRFFLDAGSIRPGSPEFPAWPLLLLAVVGLVLPLRGKTGQPRWALLAGAAVAFWLAAGNTVAPLPSLYGGLAHVLPGLDVVRAPANILFAAQLGLGLLGGVGAAALLQRFPERHRWVAALGLVAFVAVDVLRPGAAGFAVSDGYEYLRARPPKKALAFFRELEALGDRGPLYEVPSGGFRGQGRAVLLSAYHGRRTSACASSYRTPEQKKLEVLASRLPEEAALRSLGEAGFTTLILHHGLGSSYAPHFRTRLEESPSPLLRELQSSGRLTAYAIEVPREGPASQLQSTPP
jgi:hypothetical protein